ncbi:MAG: SNF7 family protein [archaeon]|nr:SNF7 family protein [archaeon]
MKKFASWLSGDPQGKNTAVSSITKLRVFIKRLQRQSAKLNSQAKIARRKAVELRKNGDVSASRMHMKAALQQKKWAEGVDNYVLQIQGLQFKLEQAKAVGDISNILKGVATAVAGLQANVNAPQISELVDQIDMGIQDFDVTQEITESGLESMTTSSEVSEEDIDNALAEVDSEISVETGQALPTAGDGKITELEKEIQRLKEGK